MHTRVIFQSIVGISIIVAIIRYLHGHVTTQKYYLIP